MSDEDKSAKRSLQPADLAPPPASIETVRALANVKTSETWCAEKGTPDWLYAGARVGNRWPVGQEMTEAKYDAAIDAAGKVESR